ncbi:Glutathione S-transferase theta-3 [Apodemus speciosus]|uniref:Glutathione S-transferase theta-3 n=1 Tax=Apodemus speciosus TaxID=105296 RepID=A0ABQ0F7M0_APOSI
MFPVFLGEPIPPELLAATLAELDASIQVLEDKFLQDKDFLAGPHISLADLVAITELMQPVGGGCPVFEGRPRLAAWYQRVEAAVGKDLFREAHEVILKSSSPEANLRGLPAATPTTSAMGLELYLDLMSQPCRAVYIFAKKNGIPFQLRTIELLKGQHYTDSFAQVNPLRKVPALKDGDFLLAESVKMMFPMFLGQPVPPEMLASTLAELDGCLQMLEDKFLQDQAFLAGSHISVADLVAITELMHPVSAGCKIFESRPKLAAWRQRVEAAVGEGLFQEAHEVVLKAKDMPPLMDPTLKEKLKLSVQCLLH